MANRIKVAMRNAILGLRRQGWSFRRIARELGVHRKTVARHVRLAESQNGPNPTAGNSGPESLCEPFREAVLAKLDAGLSAQRVWQDLVDEHGFAASYESVKRYVRRLGARTPLPFRRIEVEPGAEVQVDFGRGAPVVPPARSAGRARPLAPRLQ